MTTQASGLKHDGLAEASTGTTSKNDGLAEASTAMRSKDVIMML
jgi:hypothetical protein